MKLNQISFLSVFATLLVLTGHSDITLDFKELWVYKWVYSFHMPLFFFVSGFLFAFTNPKEKMEELDSRKFLLKKVKRLLVPYIFISSIIFFIKGIMIPEEQMQNSVSFDFTAYSDMLMFHPIGFMWFLPALFCVFIIFISIKRYIYKPYIVLSGGALLFIISLLDFNCSFFQIASAINYSVYFGLGILYCQNKMIVDENLKKYNIAILVISFILSAMLIPIHTIAALTGIVFSIALSLMLEKYCGHIIVTLSNYTYTIFLLSYFPQMFIRGPIAHKFGEVNQYILSATSFISGFFIPVIIAVFYNKYLKKYKLFNSLGVLIGL